MSSYSWCGNGGNGVGYPDGTDPLPCEYCGEPATHTAGEGPFRLYVCEQDECKDAAFDEVCSRGEQP